MKKILITGAAGLVGQKIVAQAEALKIPFLATARSLPPELSSAGKAGSFCLLDITDKAKVDEIIGRYQPNVVIHSAAMTQVDLCETNRDQCYRINVEGTRNIVQAAEACKAHLIHLSTDFIFDGKNGPYAEDAAPHPLNYYGESKLEAEKIVSQMNGSWAIARTILVYGFVPHLTRSNIAILIKDKLSARQSMRIVTDQIRTPTLAEDLAAACITLGQKNLRGIYHIGGAESVSIYEFAQLTARIFELDSNLIQPVTTAALKEIAHRPLKSGFIIKKAQQDFGYRPHRLEDGLKLVRQQSLLYNDSRSI